MLHFGTPDLQQSQEKMGAVFGPKMSATEEFFAKSLAILLLRKENIFFFLCKKELLLVESAKLGKLSPGFLPEFSVKISRIFQEKLWR